MSVDGQEQCKALTEDGEQCSQPAEENGFCRQHGPDDETFDERDAASDESRDEESDKSTDIGGTETISESESTTDIVAVRERIENTAEEVIGRPLEGVTSVNRDDEGWHVSVEVLERKGVPDTQDILGRYELRLDESLTISSYERTHRFRRDDMEQNV